jgi:hypothetical protein
MNQLIAKYNDMTAENPEFSLITVQDIKNRIETNSETEKDYADLDVFLSSVNMGRFILKNMQDQGYLDYSFFLKEKSKPIEKRNIASESLINGVVKECIKILIQYLTTNDYIS